MIRPATLTALGLTAGLLAAALIALHHPWLASLLLLFSGLCDILDGKLARHQKVDSPSGALLDILSDRAVEASVVIGLFLFDPTRALLSLLMLTAILLCVTSFLVVGIFAENESHKSFHYSRGVMERPEAFAFFLAMILWPGGFLLLASLFVLLVLLTALLRTLQFLRQARGQALIEREDLPS